MMKVLLGLGFWLVIGCSGTSPPSRQCEPSRVMLDGVAMQFEHGKFGYRKNGAWTIAMFSSSELFEPGEPTCANVLGSSSAAGVAITAFDLERRMGSVAYDLHMPSATGIATYAHTPGTRCADARCNRIEGEVVAKPAAVGADLAMCVSAIVHFTDNDGVAHELTIDGRVVGTYCGVKP